MQARQLAPHAHAFNALINATGRAFRLGDVAGLVRGGFSISPAGTPLLLCCCSCNGGMAPADWTWQTLCAHDCVRLALANTYCVIWLFKQSNCKQSRA